MIINTNTEKKGRGKFKPAPNLSIDEINTVLLDKIKKENQLIIEDNDDTQAIRETHYSAEKFNVASLFSGAGGLDLGVELAGLVSEVGETEALKLFSERETYEKNRSKSIFKTIYTNDMFKEANLTYKNNFPSDIFQHQKDIKKVPYFPKNNMIIGGFPCPGFSEAGPRLIDDDRNFLYIHFIRALIQSQPEFFVAENVKGMMTLGKGEVLKQIIEDFSSAGYTVTPYLVNAKDYGVPQSRERVFLIGVNKEKIEKKYTFHYELPVATHGKAIGQKPYVTLKDAIGDLYENPGLFFKGSFSTIYMSRNRKKNWSDQSFTIQASGRQAPMHPGGKAMTKVHKNLWEFQGEENRRLSIKEIQRIQTFPDWFNFSDGNSNKLSEMGKLDKIYKQIGNAVPVLLAQAIVQPISDFIKENIL